MHRRAFRESEPLLDLCADQIALLRRNVVPFIDREHQRPALLDHRPQQTRVLLHDVVVRIDHGHNQQVFGVGSTLRRAIDRAVRFAQSGAVVVAVARVPPNRIFVFHDQIVRVVDRIREQEFAEDERIRRQT